MTSRFWSHDFMLLLSIYFCIWFLILLSNQVRSFELKVRNSLLNSQFIQTLTRSQTSKRRSMQQNI